MSYAVRTAYVRLSYALCRTSPRVSPAYDKNAQISYVGKIAYEHSYAICTDRVRVCTSPNNTQSTGPQWGAGRVGGKGAMPAHCHLRLQYRIQPVVRRDADDVHTRAAV